MSTHALITMIIICGLVWGGFTLLLIRAIRSESAKKRKR